MAEVIEVHLNGRMKEEAYCWCSVLRFSDANEYFVADIPQECTSRHVDSMFAINFKAENLHDDTWRVLGQAIVSGSSYGLSEQPITVDVSGVITKGSLFWRLNAKDHPAFWVHITFPTEFDHGL